MKSVGRRSNAQERNSKLIWSHFNVDNKRNLRVRSRANDVLSCQKTSVATQRMATGR